MKKITVGLVGVLVATSLTGVFAQEAMMQTSMMKDDSMMSVKSNLMLSSRGVDVVALQTFLESEGHLKMPQGVAKGYFGNVTKMALIKYQAREGLPTTGFFGPLTRAKWMAMKEGSMMKKDETMMKKDAMSDGMMMKDDGVMVGGALMISSRDIVDNAVLASNVTTVVAAVKAAGLVDTLKSKGPFTVFAPNNAAFAALPAGTVETLLKPENKATLTGILTYHVVAGSYKVKDLMDGQMLTTVNGKTLKITKVDGKVMINGVAMIETQNVISSNGVTHVISAVLLP